MCSPWTTPEKLMPLDGERPGAVKTGKRSEADACPV